MQYQVSNSVKPAPFTPMVSQFEKPLTMSSLQIAEFTGKEHKNVMRDIRDMFEALGDKLKSEPIFYRDSMNREKPMYELDEDHSITLVSGYDVKMRMAIIKEWKALKESNNKMLIAGTMTSKQLLVLTDEVTQKEHAQSYIMKQHAYIEYIEPKAEFFDDVSDSSGVMDMGIVAKQLGMGRNTFFKLLRQKHILQSGKHKNNQPYQQFITGEYFTVKLSGINDGFVAQTFVTPKGLTWLHKKVKEWELH